VDYAENARSLGAHAIRAGNLRELKEALEKAKTLDRTTVIVVETDREVRVPGYDSWWDVAVAEVSDSSSVQAARDAYVEARKKERVHL
jgi:3D-(3,5/4)-trihydroxycyclohexane-1,2-dione acylhydrolase (decyclizing)